MTEGIQPELESAFMGKMYTVGEITDICLADRDFYLESGGGVTLTGGEALMQAGFAVELLGRLKEHKIHTAMETSGYAPVEIFLSVSECVDLLLYDIKHYDSEKHRQGTGADNKIILDNLREAVKRGYNILVRIPVITGYNDSLKDAAGFAKLIKEIGLKQAQLLPFHQFGQKKYETLGMPYLFSDAKPLYPDDLRDYLLEMKKHGVNVFI